jgi:imidazolonepropionase
MHVDLIVDNVSQLVTLAGPPGPRTGAELGTVRAIPDGALAVKHGRVVAAGARADVLREHTAKHTHDAARAALLPGLVDPHTHLVFARDRVDEWERRLAGATYQEIAAEGGGIRASVRHLRAASRQELVEAGLRRLDRMLSHGTTTCEIKSGYGLALEHERKSLEAVRELDRRHPIRCVPTFLGAHEVPDEHRADRETYLRLLIDEMIPALAPLARFCDVFCEEHVFTVEESRRVLEAGKRHGLAPKLHADELAPTGGAELAAEVGAVSADHLVASSDEGIRRMAEAGVIPVLLPGTCWFLRLDRRAPARAMVEAGLAVALATDCNPGSCPTESLPMAQSLACHELGLTPAEALVASTVNAAHAVGEGEEAGSLEPGKRADFMLIDGSDWRAVPYHFGVSIVAEVFVGGALAWQAGARVAAGL